MDEALAEQVLTEQEPEPAAVWALRQATLAGKICPVSPAAPCAIKACSRCWMGGAAVAGSAERPPSLAHDADGGESGWRWTQPVRWRRWRSRCKCGKAVAMCSPGCIEEP